VEFEKGQLVYYRDREPKFLARILEIGAPTIDERQRLVQIQFISDESPCKGRLYHATADRLYALPLIEAIAHYETTFPVKSYRFSDGYRR